MPMMAMSRLEAVSALLIARVSSIRAGAGAIRVTP